MSYQIIKELPSLKEALEAILSRCFPEMEYSPYNYVKACNEFPIDLDIGFAEFDTSFIGILSARLVNFIPVSSKVDKDERFDLIKESFYKKTNDPLRNRLNPFIEWNYKSVSGWLNEKQTKMNDSTLFRGTAFYTLGLLSCANCDEYVSYCYERLGLEGNVSEILSCASLLNWKDELVLFLTFIMLGCSNGAEWTEKKVAIFEKYISERMSDVKKAELVERAWLNDVLVFRPRSLQDAAKVGEMQDYYVHPEFSTNGCVCSDPVERLINANVSTRQLIVARTGMGKSMYARLASLSMCRRLLTEDTNIAALENKMPAPADKYVIYLPAHMFSYCYNKTAYQSWTADIVELYFNCMTKLGGTYNFDKRESREERVDFGISDFAFTEEIKAYIKSLSREGRLVLVADSFDEILAGSMRNAYLTALRAFYTEYCNDPEAIGAHIIVTSREMSQTTMSSLASAIGIRLESSNVVNINPLSREQQSELITNWARHYNSDTRKYLGQLDNHFFTELCSNPYMLSVVCNKDGRKPNIVLNQLVKEILSYRIKPAVDNMNDEIFRSILDTGHTIRMFQNLAFDTIQHNCPHFSIELLTEHCRQSLAEEDLSEEEFNYCFEVIISLFTTAVGLIVPADKEDDKFQFISDFFRYELAASGIAAKIMSKKGNVNDRYIPVTEQLDFCRSIFDKVEDDKAFLDLIIPLICKTESAPFNEGLIKLLVFRNYSPGNEWLANRALIDLIMARYGGSIINKDPRRRTPDYYYQVGADTVLIVSLLSNPFFNPTEEEKKAIRESYALKVCSRFISDEQRNSLQ